MKSYYVDCEDMLKYGNDLAITSSCMVCVIDIRGNCSALLLAGNALPVLWKIETRRSSHAT